MQIISQSNFNPQALQSPDLYVVIQAPPSFIAGTPVDVLGLVGTAPWGPLNQPQLMGSPLDLATDFGLITSAAPSDLHDLPTAATIAFAQAQSQAALQIWGVRVSDGTDTRATAGLNDSQSSPIVGAVLGALYSGTMGNAMAVLIAPGTVLNSYSVTLIGFANGYSEIYPNIPNASGSFWANLQNALANGINGVRGPSQLARVITVGTPTVVSSESGGNTPATGTAVSFTLMHGNVVPGTVMIDIASVATDITDNGFGQLRGTGIASGTINYATGAVAITMTAALSEAEAITSGYKYGVADANGPGVGSVSFAGGTDGRSVTTAELVGNNVNFPYTGLYALHAQNPVVGLAAIVGFTDNTAYADIQIFADSEGLMFGAALPTGTSTAAALAAIQGYGVNDYDFAYMKDWIYFFDPVNAVVRLVSPESFIMGRIAALAPQYSPLNVPVYGVVGTERNNPLTGVNQPYSSAEIGQLNAAGIMFVTNPVPGGNYWGIRTGVNSSSNPVEQPVEFSRMTNFLAHSFGGSLGQFVGGQNLQTNSATDPLRASVSATLNGFLQSLVDAGMISGYLVTCNTTNNTPTTVAGHFLYAYIQVTYMSSVWYFVAQLQGGTTVVTSGSSLNQALAA